MHITRYLCGLGLLWVVCLYELHHESLGCYCTGATLEWPHGYVLGGCVMAMSLLSEDALKIAEKRREAKRKGEKERYTHLDAEFQ